MKTQFTPGPWRMMLAQSEVVHINIPQNDNMAAVSGINRQHNAALISAAPEMFEALEVIVRELSQHPEFDMGNSKVHYCVHKALSAIAKAKGEGVTMSLQDCESCNSTGVILASVSGVVEIQRCDTCQRYASDSEARAAIAKARGEN